ncbi:MAG: tripartite tricarboxylate transporter permease [Clostridia bacterium]|nr:tripartite tricarboxylate transporter permease [Clostridia bacterium]
MISYLPYIFSQLIVPMNLALMIVGTAVGIIFGAIPGLSGTMAVMLFMPLTYSMESSTAIIFLLALWIGGCSGAFIGSVLLGIPGSASAVATCWDGHPMAKKGQASKALAIGMTASFVGTFFSAIIGGLLAEKVADFAFAMGPWEYTALCLVAMTMVLAISKGNMFKGLASTCIGMLLATVGFSPIDAEPRFVFDNMYLYGGLGMIVVLTGIFAVSHILVTLGKGFDQPPEVSKEGLRGFGLKAKDITDELGNIIRSFLIGLGIGFLPGMGSGLSNLVAYSSAKNASKHPEEYGHGAAGGIWSPEVANNAAIGGAMIPMAALGIPGDSTTALLIGALTIHGLEMGPMVFKNSGDVVYLMFVTVAVVAGIVLLLQALCKRWFPYILKVPSWFMYSALLVICLASAYVDSGNLYKCGMMMVFALVGILMTLGQLPSSPLILAFILTPTLEKKMLQGFQSVPSWTEFFTRPVSGVLMVIAIICIFSPLIKMLFAKIRGNKG